MRGCTHRILALAACLALLTACGGSGAGSQASTPAPTATPTASVAPSEAEAPDYTSLAELLTAVATTCDWKRTATDMIDVAACAKPSIVAMVFHGRGEPMTRRWIERQAFDAQGRCSLWTWLLDQRRLAVAAVPGASITEAQPAGVLIGPRWLVFYDDPSLGAAMASSSRGVPLPPPPDCAPPAA